MSNSVNDIFIGEYSWVNPNALIGEGTKIGRFCVIEEGVKIGKNCIINDYVTLMYGVEIGDHSIIQSRSMLGSDGFGYAMGPEGQKYIPQVGSLKIGAKTTLSHFSTVDRGALNDTEIGSSCSLSTKVHIPHNLTIGDHAVILHRFVAAGSTHIGKNFWADRHVSVAGHLHIGNDNRLADFSRITRNTSDEAILSGSPPMDPLLWSSTIKAIQQLSYYAEKINEVLND